MSATDNGLAVIETPDRPSAVPEKSDSDPDAPAVVPDLGIIAEDSAGKAEVSPELVTSPSGAIGTSPLDAFFGFATDPREAALVTQQALDSQAAFITDCMANEGFGWLQYPREVRFDSSRVLGPPSLAVGIDEQYGYGIASSISSARDGGSEGPAAITGQDSVAWEQIGQEYDRLSSAEQAAFDASIKSCGTDAVLRYPENPLDPSITAELRDEIDVAIQGISDDPGFDEIWSEWARCMAALGYSAENRSDLFALLEPWVEEARRGIRQSDPLEPLPDDVTQIIEDLRKQELQIATHDLMCAELVGVDIRVNKLRRELEQRIVEENGDRWTLMRASVDD